MLQNNHVIVLTNTEFGMNHDYDTRYLPAKRVRLSTFPAAPLLY